MSVSILIVEDEKAIREMLKYALQGQDYEVLEARDVSQAYDVLAQTMPDLLLVDWMMPGVSGVDFIKRLRKDDLYKTLPIIMLTARVQESDMVKGLDVGADDYLTKPVAIVQLLARIRALLRRASPIEDDCLKAGGIKMNLTTHQVEIDNVIVAMGQTEFKLLKFFMEKQNRVYSREQLLDFVWGRAAYLEERTVDVHMLRLRKLLKPHNKETLLTTVRGMGYMFSTDKK
jgi:two-component system phosphate regulon response regulator PhoB